MSGRVIAGRYELATILGQGGMGQVWTAYDQRLDRRVAVKLLRPDRVAGPTGSDAADELRRRFVRECRVTAQVDHPGLVTVHDAGSDGDDLFLVMQYVEGADLADHLAEQDPYPGRGPSRSPRSSVPSSARCTPCRSSTATSSRGT